MLPTRPLLRILLALLRCSALSAEPTCEDIYATHDNSPVLADCRHILSHLVSLPPHLLAAAAGSRRLAKSLPFLPKAAFIHDRCVILTGFGSAGRHADVVGPATAALELPAFLNMIENSYGEVGDAARTEAVLFRVWSLVTALARRLVDECVARQEQPGEDDATVRLPGLSDPLSYSVSVAGTEEPWVWGEGYYISIPDELGRALEWGQRPGWGDGHVWFDRTFYYV